MKKPLSNLHFPSARDGGIYLVLALLATIFLVQLIQSLGWRLQFDTAIMHYVAYLINEHGFAPYRDIFDINMPGSYLVHMAIGKIVGYSDQAFRIVDITWLLATLTVTWLIMKPAGRVAAWASCLLFGLIYIGGGAYMGFQRDFLAIFPMAVALLITTRRRTWHSIKLVHFLLGVLFAFAALIKPHMVIGLPTLVVYSCMQGDYGSQPILKLMKAYFLGVFFALLGLLFTLAIPVLWLWKIGSIQSFWEILSSYLPLYVQMNIHHNFAYSLYRFKLSLISYLEFGGSEILLMSSIFSAYYIWMELLFVEFKRLSILLLSLTIIYSIYAVMSARLLPYHWMPYTYFACLCIGLILATPFSKGKLSTFSSFVPIFVFIFTVVVTIRPVEAVFQLPESIPQLLDGYLPPLPPPKDGRVDEIAAYLGTHLKRNDRVQPLDFDGGALQGMLLAKAVTATPYICDFSLYHHVSTSYIQGLRQDFLGVLEQTMPTFIIDVHEKTKVSGIDTTYEFPELENFIAKNYGNDYTGNGFNILKKNIIEE